MNKIKITLIKIGRIDHLVNFKKISKWQSKLFTIEEIQCVEYLPNSDISDGYLDQKFTRESLGELITCPNNSNITVAITLCRFVDNFYMHRIGSNQIGISLYGINEILNSRNISIENFIIKQLYEIVSLSLIVDLAENDEVYNIVHRDTRGCLFDMNGDRTNILYNTEKPIICDSCKEIFRRKQINQKMIQILDKELKKIRQPFILKVEGYIKEYPFVSMIISAIIALGISGLFKLIWKLFEFLMASNSTASQTCEILFH